MDLFQASLNGDVARIDALVAQNPDVNIVDDDFKTPLFSACMRGHVAAIDALVGHGARVNHNDDSGKTPVHYSSFLGYVDAVNTLHSLRATINRPDLSGKTPLHLASQAGHVDVIVALVGYGAPVQDNDNLGKTPLFAASENGHIAAINTLVGRFQARVDATDNSGETPLFYASKRGHVDAIDALVGHGAGVNYTNTSRETPLFSACLEGHIAAIDALKRHGANINHADDEDRTPLHYSSSRNQVSVIDALVTNGAHVNSVDSYGKTPLHLASLVGHVDTIHALARHGAGVNQGDLTGQTPLFDASSQQQRGAIDALMAHSADINHADSSGMTPLHFASFRGQVTIVDALVRHHADLNHVGHYGTTPLHYASLAGNVDAIVALVRHGAHVNPTNNSGATPLHLAVKEGHLGAVDALVGRGANVNSMDNSGKSPLSYAYSRTFLEAISTLLRHGADISVLDTASRNHGYSEINSSAQKYMEDFFDAGADDKTKILQNSVSLNRYISVILESNSQLKASNPFNISLDSFSDDGKMGMLFRYGRRRNTVVSIRFDRDGRPSVSHIRATAPICAGEGRVIYTKKKGDKSLVYENGIDLSASTETELCHDLSGSYEKNWGCFGRTNGGDYLIVYTVIPLRIFKVQNRTKCTEIPGVYPGFVKDFPPENIVVKSEYPNFDEIERIFASGRDKRGTTIFRGGTRGIEWGDEFLFVGHVTVHQPQGGCFPDWVTQRNTYEPKEKKYGRMYFMYFYTVRLSNGIYKISRISSSFQPPSARGNFHKIIFPSGIALRTDQLLKKYIVVSFGRNDNESLITSYAEAEVNTMLAPVHSWNTSNYVFHRGYASCLRKTGGQLSPHRSVMRSLVPRGEVGLIGTSAVSPDKDDRFNPAITNYGSKFVTAWRNLKGSVASWKGYNQVTMEVCSLKIGKEGKLVYTRKSEMIEFQAGTRVTGGEDPRLITENECPLLMVNDLDDNGNRRMYVHNLETDDSAMTLHPFCHNISGKFEKNWGPFYDNGNLLFVYSLTPLRVGKVAGGFRCPDQKVPTNITCEMLPESKTPETFLDIIHTNDLKMRGGTPGLKFGENEYLFVGHGVQHGAACFADFKVERAVRATDNPDWQNNFPKLSPPSSSRFLKTTAASGK